jgi:carbonic anhydrase
MHRAVGTTGIILALGTGLALKCTEHDSGLASGEGVSSAHAPSPSFLYFGRTGPAFWGGLDPAWGACANGRVQSPVDFGRKSIGSERPNLSIDYGRTGGEIFNNVHTIEIETEGENGLNLGGEVYTLSQFHFHVPSEHTIKGDGHDMELHLVHTSAAGANAVVAVFLDRGASSGALSPIFGQLPDDINVHHKLDAAFDPAEFLPDDRSHVLYSGSLTTPPCTDGVRWVVLTSPVSVSSEDLAKFDERIHFNARPVQRSLP